MPHEYDLLMKGGKRKMWVNVYRDYPANPVGYFVGLKPYATEGRRKITLVIQKITSQRFQLNGKSKGVG